MVMEFYGGCKMGMMISCSGEGDGSSCSEVEGCEVGNNNKFSIKWIYIDQ